MILAWNLYLFIFTSLHSQAACGLWSWTFAFEFLLEHFFVSGQVADFLISFLICIVEIISSIYLLQFYVD